MHPSALKTLPDDIEAKVLKGRWEDVVGYDRIRHQSAPWKRLAVNADYAALRAVLDRHNVDIVDIAAHADQLYVSIPRQQWERLQKPDKESDASLEPNTREAVLRDKVRAALFDNGRRAWHKHRSSIGEPSHVFSRCLPRKDLGIACSDQEIEQSAASVLVEQGIQLQQIMPYKETVFFTLNAQEFAKLEPQLGAGTAGLLAGNVSHMARFNERQEAQKIHTEGWSKD